MTSEEHSCNHPELDDDNDLMADSPEKTGKLSLPLGFFYADTVDEIRAEALEGSRVCALIFDRTEDDIIRAIQKMAMTLDFFLRSDDIGFRDVHMQFTNDPNADDVSYERTADGYVLHLHVGNSGQWCLMAYELGILMMHCLIDHLHPDSQIIWVEQLICEGTALALLQALQANWDYTPFYQDAPNYAEYIKQFIQKELFCKGTSALLQCRDQKELEAINARNLFADRIDESHALYSLMQPEDLLTLAQVREYEYSELLLGTQRWRRYAADSKAVDYICSLQDNIPDSIIPSTGVRALIRLENSRPTEEQKQAFATLIRALQDDPNEYIIFTFMGDDAEDEGQQGLCFYQMCREANGKLMAEVRVNTEADRKMYRITVDDEEAFAILNGILETREAPDISTWKDVTAEVFPQDD